MNRRWFTLSALTLLVMLGVAPRAIAAQDPAAFIGTLGTEAIQVLGPQVPEAQRVARFRQIFRSDFDVPGIAQFVLGRYWNSLDPQQQQEFLTLFQEYIVQAYSSRLGQYGGAPFRVTGTRPYGGETVVSSQVTRANGPPIEIDWHVIPAGGGFKITDVFVGGVSMKVTQRDEFASVIQNNGNRPAAVLAVMRQKLGMAR